MNAPHISTRPALSRRSFLRATGVLLSLPLLDSMTPAFADVVKSARLTPGGKPRRFLGICNNLGLLPEYFFPANSGRDYTPSPYLALLNEHRNEGRRAVGGRRAHRALSRRDAAAGL